MDVRYLSVETATPEAVAPFGTLIGGTSLPSTATGFYGQAIASSRMNFVSDADTQLSLCTVNPRPFEVRWMERHFKHTQVFVPLGGKPFIAILAPPSDGDLPVLDQARAFRFDGDAALSLHVGTWHEFPFALEDTSQILVILRGETLDSLRPENALDGEAIGPDIEKRDIVRRLGIVLKLADMVATA